MNFDALATLQFRVAHRHQLLRAGISASAIQRRLHTAEWQRLLPAVYGLFAEECQPRHRLIAALLYAGADAQLAGPTALHLHGLRHAPLEEQVHLLIPHHRHLGSVDFAVLHRTSRLPVPRPFGRFPLCPLPRSVADMARWGASSALLRNIVAEAVQRRLVTVDTLRAELAGSQRNRTGRLRRVLTEFAEASSPSAGDLRVSLLQSRVLPRILWNPTLLGADGRRLPGPEAWIPEAALGLEIDTSDDASGATGWEHSLARHSLLEQYGALVLNFPGARLRRDPAGVRRAVERAYLQRLRSGTRAAILVG